MSHRAKTAIRTAGGYLPVLATGVAMLATVILAITTVQR